VEPRHLEELRKVLGPVSDSYLRRLLRESGAALHPLVEGVRQSGFEELERTLLALLECDRTAARRLVIEAKDHAKLALRREPDPAREEMILWMLTWLENPEAFPIWVRLKKGRRGV
jgi:hypothetical protein